MPWYTKLTLDNLVAQLQRANYAYHNNGHSIMSDDDYDRGLEELRRRSPAHPFLSVIGAPVPKGAVLLPVIMGSQDKVRAGEDGLARWLRRSSIFGGGGNDFVVSEKLDGLSALLVLKDSSTKLYLRGDGVKGVNINSAIPGIQGIRAAAGGTNVIVRGELLLRKEDTPEGSIGRSLVNGWIHRALNPDAERPEEYRKIRFVAYQVIEPAGLTRKQQMEWLVANGYEVPWWSVWGREKVNEEMLTKGLIECKMMGKYPLDGLIVATNTVPVCLGGGEASNPPDSVAFKASLDDQKAETTVLGVTWTASRQGIWVPRIQIEPVQIGGANIQWLSGHNAGFIRDNGVGVGARIVVRRSGDVIPALDEVLERAAVVAEPAEGMWKWDEKKVQAVATDDCNPSKVLLHGLQTLGVEGVGPGLVEKLVEAGVDSMLKLWMAKESVVAGAIGKGRGAALLSSLKEKRRAAGYMTLLIASNKLPRGVGERKLRVLFEKEPDPRKWGAAGAWSETPAGWSADSLKELWRALPKALEWIDASFPMAGRPQVAAVPVVTVPVVAAGTVVFTGVRDHPLEEVLKSRGWTIGDAVSKKTTIVVVADGEIKESTKTKKARELGIEILGITAFKARVT